MSFRHGLLCALLLGCGPSVTLPDQKNSCSLESAPLDGQPVSQLGRQVDGPFQPLIDGDVLTLVHGPQGGQHVYVVVHTWVRKNETWIYSFKLVDAQGTQIASVSTALDACGPGWTTSTNVRLVVSGAVLETDAVLTFSARPLGGSDAGTGSLDETVKVIVK